MLTGIYKSAGIVGKFGLFRHHKQGRYDLA